MTPLPTIWFGRHPNGCVQTMLPTPLWISSSISPVKNQPSPVWLPMETKSLAISARFAIRAGAVKCLLFISSLLAALRKYSRREMPMLQRLALDFFPPKLAALKLLL